MIIQCPYCSGPLMKGLDDLRHLAVNFSFEMVCPHCKEQVKVDVTFERTVIINNTKKSTKLGPDNIRIINHN